MNVRYKVIFLALFFLISSCEWIKGASLPTQFSGTNIQVPAGTPAFQMGFKHGCSNVSYARGNVFYRNTRKYQYDPKMIGNAEYRLGVTRGYSFCFHGIVGTKTLVSFDRFLSPSTPGSESGYGVFDTSAGNINSLWGGFFQGPNIMSVLDLGGGFNDSMGVVGQNGNGVFGGDPLWAGGSKGQFFGQ